MHNQSDAGWSSLVARRAHNPKVVGSNPAPATNLLDLDASLAVLTSLQLRSNSQFIRVQHQKTPAYRGFLLSEFFN